jgi:hypothetical protein
MITESLKKFALPEEVVSLKMVFDNVRNYAICAGVFALAIWVKKPVATVPPWIFREGADVAKAFPFWTAMTVGAVLTLLNGLQSYLIAHRWYVAWEAPLLAGGKRRRDSEGLGQQLLRATFFFIAVMTLYVAYLAALVQGLFLFAFLIWFGASGVR